MNYSVKELFDLLNEQDECNWIEAKRGSESSVSAMETVCAFCNEPGMGGGYILIGIAADESAETPQYKVVGVKDLDKFQKDFSTQCASMFNLAIRPELSIEEVSGLIVIKILIHELAHGQKPAYFKTDGLPYGAMRRIGSTDQHCTSDDMHVFYRDNTSYDQTPVKATGMEDIDENALKRYRMLREKVNPSAEELTYDDKDLLYALGCFSRENPVELNMAGLLLFGTAKAQRRTFPMLRADYIRVPGNNWVEDPDNRFSTIDMMGPLILILYRMIEAIVADLPKGFLLTEDSPQAEAVGLPTKALREALVNALMHRSYREHKPTQVIRYDNRIEIINPGFSLKSEDRLGQPGSESRNPFIAAVFHDTNLAETKGSGIRAMRRMMTDAHMVPPTFESSRDHNEFTARLLLHHFLDEKDIKWLKLFDKFNLNDSQKQSLVFVREVGAINNPVYRQMSDCDSLRASNELRILRNFGLLTSKGRGKATYYIAGSELNVEIEKDISTQPAALSTQPAALSTQANTLSTQADTLSTQADGSVGPKAAKISTQQEEGDIEKITSIFPETLRLKINNIKKRENNSSLLEGIIKEICLIKPYKSTELALILKKREDYLRRNFLNPLIERKELRYLYPEMIKHPEQAYQTTKINQ